MANNTKKTTRKIQIGGHAAKLTDYKTPGAARFAVTYDAYPASVFGQGATKDAAIADLQRVATAYARKSDADNEREMWAEHEADKAEALKRGDY